MKVNVEVNHEPKAINGKLEWESHVASLRTLTGRISQEIANDIVYTNLEGAFAYEGKTADILIKLNINKEKNVVNANVVANVPNKGKFTADLKHTVCTNVYYNYLPYLFL